MGNNFLALSLFIMLLAFFIILNSLSNYEDHMSSRVLDSITVAFSKSEVTEDTTANIEEDINQSYRTGDTLDQIKNLFKSQITGAEVKKNRMGTLMHVRLPVSEFEKQLFRSSPNRNDAYGTNIAGALASLLATEDSVPYIMDILLNVDESPAALMNKAPRQMQDVIRRVAGYTEALEGAGIPKKFMTSGVSGGSGDMIDLYFRRYETYNPISNGGQQ